MLTNLASSFSRAWDYIDGAEITPQTDWNHGIEGWRDASEDTE